MFYIHKYEVAQQYGGPEEGGWWYDSGVPAKEVSLTFADEEKAYVHCRKLNEEEHERAKSEEQYGYTSVLSHQSTHYEYQVSNEPAAPYPQERPHYE